MYKKTTMAVFVVFLSVISLALISCGKQEKAETAAPAPAASETAPAPESAPATEAAPAENAATTPEAGASGESAAPAEGQSQPGESMEQPAPATETPAEEKDKDKQSSLSSPAATTTNAVATASQDRGPALALAQKSGCLVCHAVDKKVVGPAWRDVAKRYKGVAEARGRLIDKVSKGGRGNWSDVVGNVAMPPYFPRVTKQNIESLVDFILSL